MGNLDIVDRPITVEEAKEINDASVNEFVKVVIGNTTFYAVDDTAKATVYSYNKETLVYTLHGVLVWTGKPEDAVAKILRYLAAKVLTGTFY